MKFGFQSTFFCLVIERLIKDQKYEICVVKLYIVYAGAKPNSWVLTGTLYMYCFCVFAL